MLQLQGDLVFLSDAKTEAVDTSNAMTAYKMPACQLVAIISACEGGRARQALARRRRVCRESIWDKQRES